jgi:hypothetical protein
MSKSLLFVGYQLQAREDNSELPQPEFSAPKGYVDPKKIQEYVEKQRAEFTEKQHQLPFYGSIVSLAACLILPRSEGGDGGVCSGGAKSFFSDLGMSWSQIAIAFREWLEDFLHFESWHTSSLGVRYTDPPCVEIIGYDPRTFLKVMGYSLAELCRPLPPTMWQAPSTRHVETMLVPDGFGAIPQDACLERLGLKGELDIPDGYEGYCDAGLDLRIGLRLSSRLNLYPAYDDYIDEALHLADKEANPGKKKKAKKK